MPSYYVFNISEARIILRGLNELKKQAKPEEITSIESLICSCKHQLMGKLRNLEPFMRNPEWIRQEIIYERTPGFELAKCSNEKCKNSCRGKYCANCWTEILTEIHGQPGHELKCKKE